MLDVEIPTPFYPGLDGAPLQLGSLYFGTAGQNPVTNPITVYWDSAGTQPAVQPISIVNGQPTNNGTPARVWLSGDYSRLVQDSLGRQVLYEQSQPLSVGRLGSTITASDGGSIIGYIAAGASAVATTMLAKVRQFIQTPQDRGATGNGSSDDGGAFRNMLAAMSILGAAVRLPQATYVLSASGGKCLNVQDPLRLAGDGSIYTAIMPSPILASSSDDTLSVTPRIDTSATPDICYADHSFAGMQGLSLGNPSTGTRTGRYGVFLDTQAVGAQLKKYTVRETLVGQGASYAFYHLNAPANNVNGGLYGALIQNNILVGGMKLENSGDSISVVHNILAGTGWGVNASLTTGASCLEVQANNITNSFGAINIGAGSRFRLIGNNTEHLAAGAVANNHSASWDINGANGTMYAGVIKENLLSAFASSDATMLLRLRNCRGTLVEDNTFLNGAGASTAIDIGSDCQDVRIGANTFNSGISVKVNDAGVGTMGVVKAATLENSWVAYNVANETLQFIKSSDGMVHVYGSIASGTATTGTRVTQLPTGFRPSKIVTALIMQSNGTVDAIARATIESDGSVRIQGVSTTTRVDFNLTFPASNLANAVSIE